MITTFENAARAFTAIVSDKVEGSLLRNVSLGVNLPLEVTVRHQDYTDSKTKKLGRRSVVRFDRYVEMSDGSIAPVSFMCIAMIPKDVNVTSAIIQDVLGLSSNMHAGHETPGFTNIGTAVFVNGEQ